MKTYAAHAIYICFFLLGVFFLALMEKSLLMLSVYSIVIVLGALLISWAAESSEIMISEGLVLALVALLQIFPELMIETTMVLANDMGNVFSNFTGANRLLTGVGWPMVFLIAALFHRRKNGRWLLEIKLNREYSAEIIFFLLATLYSVLIFLRGRLLLYDALVLILICLMYVYFIAQLPHLSRKRGRDLMAVIPRKITRFSKEKMVAVIACMFFMGALLIFLAAGPFYRGALMLATSWGVSQFLFIQWIAPFLSEFPEKTSAFYWATHLKRIPLAFVHLLSAKLVQWTLLLALIPVIYSLKVGAFASLPLNSMIAGTNFTVATEFLLTIVVSLYAVTMLLKLRFTWLEALSLFVLWMTQFFWVKTRPALIGVYLALIGVELIFYRKEMLKALQGFRHIYRVHVHPR